MSVIPLPSLIPANLKLKDAFTDDVINVTLYESYNMIHFYDNVISDKLTAAQILAFAKLD